MNITTTYKTNSNGTGQILAKGGGKQRTIAYDDARSVDYNHGLAAGTLLLALDTSFSGVELVERVTDHTRTVSGKQIFVVSL